MDPLEAPSRIYFCRRLARGMRKELLAKYSLKKRPFLGHSRSVGFDACMPTSVPLLGLGAACTEARTEAAAAAGPTSMDTELSFVMANMGHAMPGRFLNLSPAFTVAPTLHIYKGLL